MSSLVEKPNWFCTRCNWVNVGDTTLGSSTRMFDTVAALAALVSWEASMVGVPE